MVLPRQDPRIDLPRRKSRAAHVNHLSNSLDTAHTVSLTSCTTVRVCQGLHSAYILNLTKQMITWVHQIPSLDSHG